MNHERDPYTDELLYNLPAISTDEILQILFERSLQELEELEKAERRTPERRAEEKRKVEKAKKAEGLNLSSSGLFADHQPPIKPSRPNQITLTKDLLTVVKVFRYLKTCAMHKFYDDPPYWGYPGTFPPKKFFHWVVDHEILKRLEGLGLSISERAHRFARFVHAERADDLLQETPTTSIAPPAQSGSEPVDLETFVMSLKFCYVEPYVFIGEAGKRPTPFTLPSIGFHNPGGVHAQDFISILNERNGPYYSLGPSHSYPSGLNIKDVSSDGKREPQSGEDGEESEDSTGFSEVPQKIEIPDYRKNKARLEEINKKICQFIEKEFRKNLGDGFKLYQLCEHKESGVYKFKFQTRKISPVTADSYAGMDDKQILQKLQTLSKAVDSISDADNDDAINKYMALYTQAIERKISEAEIDRHINFRKNQ